MKKETIKYLLEKENKLSEITSSVLAYNLIEETGLIDEYIKYVKDGYYAYRLLKNRPELEERIMENFKEKLK